MKAEWLRTLSAGWALALRGIRIEMREHVLGYAWALLIPMLYAFFYIYIKQELMGKAGGHENTNWDVLRAFAGITLFQCWMQTLQHMSDLIRREKGMLRGLDIGAAPFVLAGLFENGIGIGIRFVLILIAVPLLGLSLPSNIVSWVWIGVSLAVLHISAVSLGLTLAPWAALYPDVRQALRSINLPMVLISPIFYPAVQNSDSSLFFINLINPIASPLAVLLDAFKSNVWTLYSAPLIAWGGVSLLLICWTLGQLRRQIPILLERLGS